MNIVRNLLAVSALAILPGDGLRGPDVSAPTVDKSGVDQKVVDQKGDEKGKCEPKTWGKEGLHAHADLAEHLRPDGRDHHPQRRDRRRRPRATWPSLPGYDIIKNNIPNGDVTERQLLQGEPRALQAPGDRRHVHPHQHRSNPSPAS